MLTDNEKVQIREGRWEIDCPEMHLRSPAVEAKTFSGPGSIRFDETGALTFKLYAGQYAPAEHITFGGRVGRIIPDDAYFGLDARDMKGRRWTSARVLPDRHENFTDLILSGEIRSLAHTSSLPSAVQTGHLLMEIIDDVEVPSNVPSVSETSIAGVKHGESWVFDAAKFKAGDHAFLLKREGKALRIGVGCPGPVVPPHLDTWVVESLQFVLAGWLSPTILERTQARTHETEIRRLPREETKPRLQRPIATPRVDPEGAAWKMFDAYFRYVSKDSNMVPHSFSRFVYSAIEGSKGSVYAMALSMSVAIEGLLRSAFASLCTPTENEVAGIDVAIGLIKESTIGGTVKGRIGSAIGAMKGLHARQGLDRLADVGAVGKSEVKAWKALRNRSAHGDVEDLSDPVALQAFLDKSFRLTVLLYRVIFTAIGYEGPYTDYGREGWPTVIQPPAC